MKREDYEGMAKRYKELQNEYAADEKQKDSKDFYGDCEYIWAPEKGEARIIYILVMIFASIFNARILLWIAATLIYFKFMDKYDK